MASSVSLIEGALAPFDGIRASAYRVVGRTLGPWMRDRGRRVALLGVVSVVTALALGVLTPLWLLALGPIVLGVPHVVADLRYLWLQPGLHRNRRVWMLVVPALVLGAVTASVGWGFVAAAFALWCVPASRRARLVGAAFCLPLALLSFHYATASAVIFAHIHNIVAVVLWWYLVPRSHGNVHGSRRWVLGAYLLATTLILAGATDSLFVGAAGWGPTGRGLETYARQLAPFADGVWALRFVALFAFAQSFHYAIWLRLVPEEARERPAPRSFRSSLRALNADLGGGALVAATIVGLVVAGWAATDLLAARDGYLRFAVAHGYLELVALSLLVARCWPVSSRPVSSRRPGRRTVRP